MKIKGKSINNISGTLFFSILFSMFFLISTSYAQEAYITTDRDSYKDGDKIIISGNVGTLSESLPNTPVTIIIIGPTSNIAAFAQATPDPSGQFSHSISAGAPFQESGIYEVTSQYGTQKTFTTFSFTASVYNPPPPEPTLEPEPIPEPEPVLSESVVFKNPRILDSFGNLITTASVGQFVTFTALVENQQSTKIPFAFATIVKNTQGIVQTEVWITGSLSPGQSFEPILTWETVAPVNYVFSFELWTNAKDRDLLAEPHTLQIAVEGYPEPEPTPEPTPESTYEPVPEQEHESVPESTTPVMPSYADVILSEGSGVPGCEETGECFIPLSIQVDTGDTVTWFNADTAAHTVTSGTTTDGPNGIFDSSLFGAGSTFKVRFDTSGDYPYFCMVHPWMVGKVAVQGTTVTSILTPPPVLEPEPEPTGFDGITVDSSVPDQTEQNTFEDTLDNAQEQIDNDISNPPSQDDDLSELIEENRKLREELGRQGEQIDELNQEVDLLKQIIQSIQGFFGSIFG